MSAEHYVLGFYFSPHHSHVVLIQKLKPMWQRGKLNGVGGKLEDGESSATAMRREFKEEAGLDLHEDKWIHFGRLVVHRQQIDNAYVDLFSTSGPLTDLLSVTDEKLFISPFPVQADNTLSNIRWLTEMAEASFDNKKRFYEINETNLE